MGLSCCVSCGKKHACSLLRLHVLIRCCFQRITLLTKCCSIYVVQTQVFYRQHTYSRYTREADWRWATQGLNDWVGLLNYSLTRISSNCRRWTSLCKLHTSRCTLFFFKINRFSWELPVYFFLLCAFTLPKPRHT